MKPCFVITGANGFLGQAIVARAAACFPEAQIVALASPRDGGPDLAADGAPAQLDRLAIDDPAATVLIHAAAAVDWHGLAGLTANAAMAHYVSRWAAQQKLAFSVLVSGVNVYPQLPLVEASTPVAPPSLYGIGKVAAEQVWRLHLPQRHAIVRLAGLWGWQPRPTLFWNRLLLAAVGVDQPGLSVNRLASIRNYLSADDAAACLVGVGENRLAGTWLAGGREDVSTGDYLAALKALPGARLNVTVADDDGQDRQIYLPSPVLQPWLRSFDSNLHDLWTHRPAWVGGTA